jgi:mycothiol synthase
MQDIEIRPFQVRSASEADYACLNAFKNVLRLEFLPEDPPIACSEAVQRWHAMPTYVEEASWAAWEKTDRRIAAFGEASIYHTGDNEHVIDFNIEVLPEFRRQGLGCQMLRLIAEHAQRNNRRLMITEANGRVPASAEFLSGMGGRRGLEEHLNQLRVAELDQNLVLRWMEQSRPLLSLFQLGLWDGRYPEDRLQQVADLLQVVANDQPRDTLEIEDMNYAPEVVRQFESQMLAGGDQRWVHHAVDRENGCLAGLTEVFWNPNRPALLWQGFTGVMPDYRCKGLGRWLKAEMLSKVLRERPEVKVIRAGNANSNGPMLKINRELGFKPYVSWTVWQVDTKAASEYLAARA